MFKTKVKIYFLLLCTVFVGLLLSHGDAFAKKDQKLTRGGFLQVDFQLQPADDTKLAAALLKNVLDKAVKKVDKPPYLAAKLVQFQGQGGKAMLFVSVSHPTLCLASTCKVYVLVKSGKDEKWAWGFDTYAFDAYIDTKKQKTKFPAVVTLMPDKSREYWLWDNGKYKRAK